MLTSSHSHLLLATHAAGHAHLTAAVLLLLLPHHHLLLHLKGIHLGLMLRLVVLLLLRMRLLLLLPRLARELAGHAAVVASGHHLVGVAVERQN